MAFDMVVSPMEALADVGYTWQTWGGGWSPGDAIHFELLGATEQFRDFQEPGYVKAANLAAGFLPGPVGLVASFTDPFSGRSRCISKWDSPACFGEWLAGRCC
jgi:hypothetical protein